MSKQKINFITVCTDAYPMDYARKIITQFEKLSNFNVTSYCITDRPNEISDIAIPIAPPFGDGKGWWNKMYLYSKDMPKGISVYLDIDTVLIKNFDEEITNCIIELTFGRKISVVSDAIMWKNNKYSSSMMVMKHGRMVDIWEKFEKNKESLYGYDGGDQVWTGHQLNDSDVFYIDESFPKLKMNLKFHLGKKIFGQWDFPKRLPVGTKIVDCGGKPKPHELSYLHYVKENWHDVE